MSDILLFSFGAAVTTIAVTGAWLHVYTRFRREWMKQNHVDEEDGGNPAPARVGRESA